MKFAHLSLLKYSCSSGSTLTPTMLAADRSAVETDLQAQAVQIKNIEMNNIDRYLQAIGTHSPRSLPDKPQRLTHANPRNPGCSHLRLCLHGVMGNRDVEYPVYPLVADHLLLCYQHRVPDLHHVLCHECHLGVSSRSHFRPQWSQGLNARVSQGHERGGRRGAPRL